MNGRQRITRALEAKGYRVLAVRHAPYRLEPGSNYHEDFTFMEGGWEVDIDPPDRQVGRTLTGGLLADVLEFIDLLEVTP